MQRWPTPRLQTIARTIMFMAISALLLQNVMITVSQAAALSGVMPEPAVALNGSMHYHGNLAGHVHEHDGDIAGHVHVPSAPDHDDDSGLASSYMLFGLSVAIPDFIVLTSPTGIIGSVQLPRSECVDGIDPGGLIRPPSTPSIA
ncbi:MAG: hypothetical protein BGO65_09370 [Afipia sp. 64-13]|nr:MAG: hypothetical protein BGO65_09370 [Afipia sp. 64-13]